MGLTIDYATAKAILDAAFADVKIKFRDKTQIVCPGSRRYSHRCPFKSSTQAFREALLGCVLAAIVDPQIDIRLPYMNQEDNAFNGRTLDERVINPFLNEREIPSSKAPYLSALRRKISFVPETEKGLRDKEAYGAMLAFINETIAAHDGKRKAGIFFTLALCVSRTPRYVQSNFVAYQSPQHGAVLRAARQTAFATPSGGLLPVLLAVATFTAIKEAYGLPWKIDWRGINVADAASGAGGDITVSRDEKPVISVEVTKPTLLTPTAFARLSGRKYHPMG